ncbi:hypothetical protein ACTXT7_012528 [Hymenolepis weldensis]
MSSLRQRNPSDTNLSSVPNKYTFHHISSKQQTHPKKNLGDELDSDQQKNCDGGGGVFCSASNCTGT